MRGELIEPPEVPDLESPESPRASPTSVGELPPMEQVTEVELPDDKKAGKCRETLCLHTGWSELTQPYIKNAWQMISYGAMVHCGKQQGPNNVWLRR